MHQLWYNTHSCEKLSLLKPVRLNCLSSWPSQGTQLRKPFQQIIALLLKPHNSGRVIKFFFNLNLSPFWSLRLLSIDVSTQPCPLPPVSRCQLLSSFQIDLPTHSSFQEPHAGPPPTSKSPIPLTLPESMTGTLQWLHQHFPDIQSHI